VSSTVNVSKLVRANTQGEGAGTISDDNDNDVDVMTEMWLNGSDDGELTERKRREQTAARSRQQRGAGKRKTGVKGAGVQDAGERVEGGRGRPGEENVRGFLYIFKPPSPSAGGSAAASAGGAAIQDDGRIPGERKNSTRAGLVAPLRRFRRPRAFAPGASRF
jgi:hypothetical protein